MCFHKWLLTRSVAKKGSEFGIRFHIKKVLWKSTTTHNRHNNAIPAMSITQPLPCRWTGFRLRNTLQGDFRCGHNNHKKSRRSVEEKMSVRVCYYPEEVV